MNSWSELNHSARFKDYQTVSQLGLKGGCKKFASSLNHDSDLLNDLVDGLSRRGGCRATPPGGINTQSRTGFCFWSGAEPMQAEHGLVDYLHTCLSTWPQLRSVEVFVHYDCLRHYKATGDRMKGIVSSTKSVDLFGFNIFRAWAGHRPDFLYFCPKWSDFSPPVRWHS